MRLRSVLRSLCLALLTLMAIPRMPIGGSFARADFGVVEIYSSTNNGVAMTASTESAEPSTWALMALGFGLLGGAGHWRCRRSVSIAD